jgi:hypothetical protein
MGKRGPPDKIAQTLKVMEEHDGRVNISQFAREFDVDRLKLSRAWTRLREFKSSPEQENDELSSNIAYHLVDGRGRNTNRSLSNDEELAVIKLLKDQYPHGFNDADIRRLCHEQQHELRSKPNILSRHFITLFKQRHSITRSRFCSRTRKKADPMLHFEEDVQLAIEYIDKFNNLSSEIHPSLIINCDETPAYVKNTPASANHFAYDDKPWQWVRASDRLKVTVLAACAADGTMLKPTIVAKGKTVQCERPYAELAKDSAFMQHTNSGLTKTESFIEWIDNVVLPYTKDRRSVLILDQWPAHTTQEVRSHLDSHHIIMLEVPARGTSLLQPLDVGVFGVAKKRICAEYKADMFIKGWTEPDRWESTVACVRQLLAVDQLTILRGWQLAFPNYIDELKKRDMLYWEDKKPLSK